MTPPRRLPERAFAARERIARTGHLFNDMSVFSYRGIPRTPNEWTALARVATGYAPVSKEELRGLFMLGLVERQLGRVCLSAHGRTTLGVSQHAHRPPGSSSADHSSAH